MAISACKGSWAKAVAFMEGADLVATSAFVAVCGAWRRGLWAFRPTGTARVAAVQLCGRRWRRALRFLAENGVVFNAALKVCKWPKGVELLDAGPKGRELKGAFEAKFSGAQRGLQLLRQSCLGVWEPRKWHDSEEFEVTW